jgi:hypothetical protein
MAETNEVGQLVGQFVNQQDIVGAIDILFWVLLGVLVLVIVGLIVFIVYKLGQYKHTFIRKVITGGDPIILTDKAREFTDPKTGTVLWRLLKAKHTIARPPNKAIHPTEKGNYCVEAYYLGDINYYYSSGEITEDTRKEIIALAQSVKTEYDKNLISALRAEVLKVQKKRLFDLFRYKPSPIYVYTDSLEQVVADKNTITTNQRLIAYDEIKKAYERKRNGLAQWLPTIVSVGALVMLVVVIIVFGNDLIKPMIELNNGNVAITQSQANIAQKMSDASNMLASIIQERQMIQSGGLANVTAPS